MKAVASGIIEILVWRLDSMDRNQNTLLSTTVLESRLSFVPGQTGFLYVVAYFNRYIEKVFLLYNTIAVAISE
jgi:hypothetical protein